MEHYFQNVEGWFTQEDAKFYAYAVSIAERHDHFVEVGCYRGRSASCLAVEIINSSKQISFDCVDRWGDDLPEDSDYPNFRLNMLPVQGQYRAIGLGSIRAASIYDDRSLGMVFIDADHSTESVIADIDAWLPKIRSGGIISGHDIAYLSVRNAVYHRLGRFQTIGNCWFVTCT